MGLVNNSVCAFNALTYNDNNNNGARGNRSLLTWTKTKSQVRERDIHSCQRIGLSRFKADTRKSATDVARLWAHP